MTHADRRPVEILIHLRRIDAASPAVTIGLALARRLDAWVTGLGIAPLAAAAFATPEAVGLYVGEADAMYQAAVRHAPQWEAQLAAHGLRGEWQAVQGDVVEALCHASRWNDLLVVERPQLVPDAPVGWGVVSRTVFGAAAPVVVVPETTTTAGAGTRIVIAWNQSREAMLAIRGALPLLACADRVVVLEGDAMPNPFGLRYLPQVDLRAWLARHGVAAEFRPFAGGKDSGATLLDAAHAADADLVVLGAWGHSRITELVLGGATRHLFQYSDLPLLVAH